MSRSSSSPQSSPLRPMMRPLPPSAVARSAQASGARRTERPMRVRTRRRRQRVRRLLLRAMAAAVLALTASLLTARSAHDVRSGVHRAATAGESVVTHTVSVAP